MLQLKDISKSYTTGDFTQVALNKVNLNFRKSEFVAILGQSGSGKTTLLNVIGGLDKYDTGDLVINGKSTKKFKDRDWDAYRNNSVGFVFQSYNLIPHLSIVDNVEMGMTLSGVPNKIKHKNAIEALEKVGLKNHIHKKPNQLSGGQMQRVAIARALANDPDIILADEPTGALDTETSEQIMNLIKEIAKDKLVIMVTHNPELAERYATRIVKFSDGEVKSDTHPLEDHEITSEYRLKKTSMSFITALNLSGKNIITKKWRTGITAFASSIGIIGIALVLSLSNGFNKQINDFESGTLSNYPITIGKTAMKLEPGKASSGKNVTLEKYTDKKVIYSHDSSKDSTSHTNTLTDSYMQYLDKMDSSLLEGVSYTRSINMNILKKTGDKATLLNTQKINLSSYPSNPSGKNSNYLKDYYDLLQGSYSTSSTDLLLVVDEYNRLDTSMLKELGIDVEDGKSTDFSSIIGKEYKLIMNNDYYTKSGNVYAVNGIPTDLSKMYDSSKAITLKITGIIRIKKDSKVTSLSSGVIYSDDLAQRFIKDAADSEVVKAQKNADYNVLTGGMLADSSESGNTRNNMNPGMASMGVAAAQTKESVLEELGATSIPTAISLYPTSFDAKQDIKTYLDKWNNGLSDKDKIEYTDMSAIITNLSGSIMNGITLVLVAFAAISLVVSMIMIGIIIYISVLERTKEIGVLRALGARKKDISRVFNAETFIIGSCSGLLGIGIAYLLTFPANSIIYKATELKNVAQLNPLHAIALVLISIVLTMIGGIIPSRMAAKKDPVVALRSE